MPLRAAPRLFEQQAMLTCLSNVRPETGEVYLSDAWADEQIHWEGDDWNEPGSNLYGCFKCASFSFLNSPGHVLWLTSPLTGNCIS